MNFVSMPMSVNEERNWGVLCHLASFSGYISIPFGHIVRPLVVWLIKREQSAFVDAIGKESLNYNISLLIWLSLSALFLLCFIGIIGIIALLVMDSLCEFWAPWPPPVARSTTTPSPSVSSPESRHLL